MRERSRRASPRLHGQTTVVGRHGFRPRDQEEQRTQRASFVATHHARVNTQQQAAVSHRAGLGCLLKHATSSARARLFEASAGCDA